MRIIRTGCYLGLSLTIGCTSSVDPTPDSWGGHVSHPLPVPSLTLNVPSLTLGSTIMIEAGGTLGEGERVHLIGSRGGMGAGPCHPRLGGSCLGILPPLTYLGSGVVNETGSAAIPFPVPSSDEEGSVYTFQALVARDFDGSATLLSDAEEGVTRAPPDPGAAVAWDTLEGPIADIDVSSGGLTAITSLSGAEVRMSCYTETGEALAVDIDVGGNAITYAEPVVQVSRPGDRVLVTWFADGSTNEIRYRMFDSACAPISGEEVATLNGNEWYDAAVADDGRAVIAVTASEGTEMIFLNADGTILRSEIAFTNAAYGTHVALQSSTGAGIIAAQEHSGDQIYYRRWDADLEWIEEDSVWMETESSHYWYDGFTVGMNDVGDFVFLWRPDGTQLDAAFFDPAGTRVADVTRETEDFEGWDGGHCYDSFRRRHQEIPVREDNFILGEVYNWIAGSGLTIQHFEYTPEGELLAENDTDISLPEGLTLRLDGAGQAIAHDGSTATNLGYYP